MGIQTSVEKPDEGFTKVTGLDIEPVKHGWVVTVEYDGDECKKFAFTNLEAMISFVRDMTEHPVRVPDGVVRVREKK